MSKFNKESDGRYGDSDGRKRGGKGDRNFDKEATDLLKGLSEKQLYQLFEIVVNEMKHQCSEERTMELVAVRKAIRKSPLVDGYRFGRIINGYQSEMARTGNPKDGQYTPIRKKV
jgi:hypothetical protein